MIKRTERGWIGHFICADRCMFRRNTLLESDTDSVIISTVGAMLDLSNKTLDTIGAFGRYYETMVFGTKRVGDYIDTDVSNQREFDSPWSICADSVDELPKGVDNIANEMHETVVDEFIEKLENDSSNPTSE